MVLGLLMLLTGTDALAGTNLMRLEGVPLKLEACRVYPLSHESLETSDYAEVEWVKFKQKSNDQTLWIRLPLSPYTSRSGVSRMQFQSDGTIRQFLTTAFMDGKTIDVFVPSSSAGQPENPLASVRVTSDPSNRAGATAPDILSEVQAWGGDLPVYKQLTQCLEEIKKR